MSTPAERYAASRRRQEHARSELARFMTGYDFPFDDFQIEACRAVEEGTAVLVAAPTGSGKTIVGEFAVHLALVRGQKAFYTTPIKALSNQKYHDLVRRHGVANVGLLTGDSSVNGEAPIVVMTTEVLRNMIYAGSTTLNGLAFVVMDEVHYLADRFRGAVWEEVIIHLPEHVQLVSLSATVSNAEEFGEWLDEVRGGNVVVLSETRPVPLWQHMQVGHRDYDLFADDTAAPRRDGGIPRLNPHLLDAVRQAERAGGERPAERRGGRDRQRMDRRGRPRRGGWDSAPPESRGPQSTGGRGVGRVSRPEMIAQLDEQGLLPAITFIFSRAGCDAAVLQMLASGRRLVPEAEGHRIRRIVEERVEGLAPEDLEVLGYHDFVEGCSRGFAAHHAGMLPAFREVVEELFTVGRIRAVFATETLALGINMPARTVVLEKLVKFNGENHVDLTPAEYTQLTGRAGRRGIDVEGHAFVVWQRGMDPVNVAGLASTRTYPLRSSFAPTYNMAVNLVASVGRQVAREILETSFAQFQADRSVVGLATSVRRNQEALDGYAEAMHCELGDFREYASIRQRVAQLEKEGAKRRTAHRRAEAAVSLENLAPGDVIRIPSGRLAGWAVVVANPRPRPGQVPAPAVVTEEHQFRHLTTQDVPVPIEPVTTLRLPSHFNPKSPKARRDLAATLRTKVPREPAPTSREAREAAREHGRVAAEGEDATLVRLRAELRAHPCHACPDREEHARWAERWWRLKRETTTLQRKVEGRTNSVAATFDRICAVLAALGYLDPDGESVSAEGQRLRRLYTEKDLLAAESLRRGDWQRLDEAELAAVVSMLIHEPRREAPDLAPPLPTAAVAEAWTALNQVWRDVTDLEHQHRLEPTSPPDAGIAQMVHRWAGGRRLEAVLRDQDMAAGDFVRRCKQVVDVLDQVANAAPDEHLRRTARRAVDKVLRGVVAADRID